MLPSSLAIAPAVAGASVLVLAGTRLLRRKQAPKVGQTTKTILVYNVARFLGCLSLLGISIASPILRASNLKLHTLIPTNFLPAAVFLYASILAFLLLRSKSPWTFTFHLNTVLLTQLGVYIYRDVYPLVTYTKSPRDDQEGPLLWASIAILTCTSVLIPLFIPRLYVPVDPKNPSPNPHPEQTISIMSLIWFQYLDRLVLKAWRLSHLSLEELPPLPDYDHADVLRNRAFPILDSFSGAKDRHIFFGLLLTFKQEFFTTIGLLLVVSVSQLVNPLALNRLLYYVETGGVGATVQPWIWVALIFFGPGIQGLALEWYNFYMGWLVVRTEAVVTQLIFEHSLRIRLVAETQHRDDSSEGRSRPVSETSSIVESTIADGESTAETLQGEPEPSEATTVQGDRDSSDSGKTPKPVSTETNKKPDGKDAKNLLGKINNLVTTDLANITEAKEFLLLFIVSPLQICLCITFLYYLLGWSTFAGLGVMLLLLPLPGYLTKLTARYQKETLKRTDARVQVVTEVMNVLRMIKLFGWEERTAKKISAKREEELTWLRRRSIWNIWSMLANHIIPSFTAVATFFTIIMKKDLSPSLVFSSMTIFDILRYRVRVITFYLSAIVNGKVSLDRITEFLRKTELLDSFTEEKTGAAAFVDEPTVSQDIGFHNATFSWSDESDGSQTPSRRFRLHIKESLLFQRGEINIVVGPTGSGKTSLLLALLGEMHFVPSGPDSWFNLPRSGGISYAAQESWVLNDTIKNNILFHSPYDEDRYKKVLDQCALVQDLALFEAGDATEVGEKGLTLSGGQKARLTLARAIYSSAEIILLDDVLAALDVHTSAWIVDKCFSGDLVRGRTVILVTHNVALVSPIAAFSVSIKDGRVSKAGKLSEILRGDKSLRKEAALERQIIEKAEEEIAATNPIDKPATGKLILAEEVASGHVSFAVVKDFLWQMGGRRPFLTFSAYILAGITHHVFYVSQPWYLGYWSSQYENKRGEEVNSGWHLIVYTILTILCIGGFGLMTGVSIFARMRSSRALHQRLLQSVLGTTLRWLDTTPVSRVITRCTQDIAAVDVAIPMHLHSALFISSAMFFEIGSVFLVTPRFLLIGMGVGVIGAAFGQLFIRSQLSVKREMSNAKAPVLAHFSAAIAGLISIRAYGKQEIFIKEAFVRTNKYTRAARPFNDLSRWFGVRLLTLGAAFSCGLAGYLLYSRSAGSGNMGFSLEMAAGFTESLLWLTRSWNQFEVAANSLERLHQYSTIEQEEKPTDAGVPPAYWPASGELHVEKLSARYSPDGPKVLHDISFDVKSGERIGVVGRTGSGKSSLTLSLLRAIYTDGVVYYDGRPTNAVNLDALRSNITIIPQVPELMSGTLRENLDPFDQYDDAVLNDALRSSGLVALQEDSEEDEGRLTLDSTLASSGSNLSVGQRQILALARAIIRGSKLLILDEATSAIDYKTDSIIQSSLRNELGPDVTLITIAHRLQTIMDSDKILVLDDGHIAEFASPADLLKRDGGKFRALVDGSNDKDVLYAMANGTRS